MIKFLKFLFPCRHRRLTENVKWATRFGKPIVIEYRECQDCGKIPYCKVSFQEEVKSVPVVKSVPIPVIEVKAKPTEVPVQVVPIKKEEPKVEAPKEEPKVTEQKPVEPPQETPLREAETAEESLEKDHDEGPFSSQPDNSPVPAPGPIPDADPVDEDEIDSEVPKPKADEAMVEGACFLKESRASINRRRKDLARRRAKALEQAKKAGAKIPADGKIKIKVVGKKSEGIPFLDEPDRPGKEEEYN
jgi:type IV secretory pathway VirB10-like protein